jgi:hypothetical protein
MRKNVRMAACSFSRQTLETLPVHAECSRDLGAKTLRGFRGARREGKLRAGLQQLMQCCRSSEPGGIELAG